MRVAAVHRIGAGGGESNKDLIRGPWLAIGRSGRGDNMAARDARFWFICRYLLAGLLFIAPEEL